ncbi:MAG: hypothetical protein JNM56_20625 [Planctomycetia bacterium]|nr:hypothetical protein [Planctomycetia bacterium]
MPLLDQWKTAKTKFEAATGKKKPSEKFMGIYKKSSGVESALKKLDAAIAKKSLREVAQSKEEFRKTHETYYATMVKGAKAEAGDANYQAELVKLNVALNQIYRQATEAEEALAKDPKTPMTVEEAIGPEAVGALGRSQLLTFAALQGWLGAADAGIIVKEGELGPEKVRAPESAKYHEGGKKALAKAKVLYDAMNALLPRVMERGKAIAAAELFITKLPDHVLGPSEDALQGAVGYWRNAQEEAFKSRDVSREEAKAAYESWSAQSNAFKFVLQLEPLWTNETRFQSDFRRALRKQKGA